MPLKLCVSAFSAGESPLYTALLCVQHVGCYNLCEKQNSCLCRLISVIGVMTLFDWVTIADASYSRQIFTLNYSRPEILHLFGSVFTYEEFGQFDTLLLDLFLVEWQSDSPMIVRLICSPDKETDYIFTLMNKRLNWLLLQNYNYYND